MRLLDSSEFRQAFSSGQRLRNREFTVIARRNGLDHPRLGLAISRRSAARAVDRNRIKRVVRESFRLNFSHLQNVDIVVQATSATRFRTNNALARKLDELWAKIG